jgi:2-octaprenyl-6-methoxyphenol hydroxylase
MTDSTNKRYDIVIAGGGMIGASLALALSPLGLRIAVVEAVARGEALQPSFDDRVSMSPTGAVLDSRISMRLSRA